jgi:hypothetical protein
MEAYMVGHRLVMFLSSILPTHADYFSTVEKETEARVRSQEQLDVVSKYLDHIAMLVDKQEHEDFIRSVLSERGTKEHMEHKVSLLKGYDEKYDDNSSSGASDSTEKLDNTTIASANTMLHAEQQQPRNGPPTSDLDLSTVTDSVDVLLETIDHSHKDSGLSIAGGRSFLFEDPASTPTNTILRMVAHQQPTLDTPMNIVAECTLSTGGLSTTTSTQSGSRPKASSWAHTLPPPKPLPMQPTPLLNRMVAPQRQANTSVTDSSTSNCLDSSYDSILRVTPVPGDEHKQQRSPGGTVRSNVRVCPPMKGTTSGISFVPIKQVASSSAEPSPVRPESLFAPLTLDQHSMAITLPEAVQPLRTQQSPDTVLLQFKPLTELQKRAAVLNEESPYRKQQESSARIALADMQAATLDVKADRDHASFSSSRSSNSSRDRDDNDVALTETLSKYSSTSTPPIKKVASELERSRPSCQDVVNAWQESYSRHARKQSELSASRSPNADTSVSRSYAASATDWSMENDDALAAAESTSNKDKKNTNWLEDVSVGISQPGSPTDDEKSAEIKNKDVCDATRQHEAGGPVSGQGQATQKSPALNTGVSTSLSQSHVKFSSPTKEFNMSTDSMGFPTPGMLGISWDTVATGREELPDNTDGFLDVPVPDTAQVFGWATTMYDPFLPSGALLETTILREELASPFMIESKVEQRLKLSLNASDKGTMAPKSASVPQDIGCFGSLKSVQFSSTPELTLPLDSSENDETLERTDRNGEPRRVNKMRCRKQKSFVDRWPNDEDTDDGSLLMVKSRNRCLPFKNCFRFLID